MSTPSIIQLQTLWTATANGELVFNPVRDTVEVPETPVKITDNFERGQQTLHIMGGAMTAVAWIGAILKVKTTVLGDLLKPTTDITYRKWLEAIILFYSAPGSSGDECLSAKDAHKMLELHALGSGMREWVEAVGLTGVFKLNNGDYFGDTVVKTNLVNVHKDGKFWRRPQCIKVLLKDVSLVHAAILKTNQVSVAMYSMQQELFLAQIAAVMEVVEAAQAHIALCVKDVIVGARDALEAENIDSGLGYVEWFGASPWVQNITDDLDTWKSPHRSTTLGMKLNGCKIMNTFAFPEVTIDVVPKMERAGGGEERKRKL